jgi:tRNA U55 pseudouridine synthase TruB
MTALRRLSCGQFDESACHAVAELQSMVEQGRPLPLLSPAEALPDWPSVTVSGEVLERLQNGVAPAAADLNMPGIAAGEMVRLLAEGALVAIARYTPGVQGKKPGDFEVIKVFPLSKDNG